MKYCCFVFKSVNADVIKETCMKYIYDQCPAVVGVGKRGDVL